MIHLSCGSEPKSVSFSPALKETWISMAVCNYLLLHKGWRMQFFTAVFPKLFNPLPMSQSIIALAKKSIYVKEPWVAEVCRVASRLE